MNHYLLAIVAVLVAVNGSVAIAVVVDLIHEYKRNRKARIKHDSSR